MARRILLIFTIIAGSMTYPHAAAAQFTVKLPKVPKAEKPQPSASADAQQIQQERTMTETRGTVADQASIQKDSVQAIAFTLSAYRGSSAVWSWVPKIKFAVNGPIESGSLLSVEFTLPGSGVWVNLDCKTDPTSAGFRFETECGGREIPEDKGSTYTGVVNFTIRLRNELAGTNTTLFTGKMKVAKVHSNETTPNAANHFVFYVDHDWNLPIGYVFYEGDLQFDADDPRRWAKPKFSIAFWTRGERSGFAEPHLFFGGKEVGKLFYNGGEVGVPNCSVTEAQNNTTHTTQPPGQFVWTRWKCTFNNVIPWNRSSDKNETMFGRLFLFSENPGSYEVKIMHGGHLIRAFKFAVDAQGKLVDDGIGQANKMGTDRIIVPVQVLGDQDGPWNRTAWKTDAFYGNPLTGFNAP